MSEPMSAAWITSVVEDFIADAFLNNLQNSTGEKAFAEPLVGFAGGADPIFADYKEHVGPFHWTPLEIFRIAFPDVHVEAEALTVISWILPQTRQTRVDNRKQDRYPAERWARARVFGEMVNEKLRDHVVARLGKEGVRAVAPIRSPLWSREISPRYGFASKWSERHAAYAAGLGTFGLCDGLITEKGKAMRTGSVVAMCRISPTRRRYTDHHAYCLFFARGTCGKCIDRCPAGAISESGHDKEKCKAYQRSDEVQGFMKERYGFDGKGCGLCQTKVPCEALNPVRGERRK
ncbi:MAG: epoxyqueuosine reductase [Desulfobacterales bacterium]